MENTVQLKQANGDAGTKGGLSRRQSLNVIDALADGCRATESERNTVKALHNAFRTFSSWSAQHSIRVGLLSSRLSERAGLNKEDASRLGLCSCLHDVGKIAIPTSILDKADKLTTAEREVVEEHVKHGLTVLNGLHSSFQSIADVVIEHHHENYDGTGYPGNLKGSEIPDEIAIVRIVDFYDAVYFDRPYRRGLGQSDAISLMDRNAVVFEPDFFLTFKNEVSAIEGKLAT